MATLDGQNITTGHVRQFERGDSFGELSTDSGIRIPDGKRVTIEAQGVTLSCAIVRGGVSGDIGHYQIAGRPEWSKPLPSKAIINGYGSANSVLLKTVLSQLCLDVLGPNWAQLVSMPESVPLGTHYERPGTKGSTTITGRDILELLELPWYVRNDGITVFAERPSGNVVLPDDLRVEYRNDAIGYRVINTEFASRFAPGLTFEGEVIGECVLVFGDDIRVHTWSRAASGALENCIRGMVWRAFPRLLFQGIYAYTTVGATANGKHDLVPTGSKWLPNVKLAPTWSSIAGASVELQPGTRVAIAFLDADPAKPVLVAVEPSAVPQNAAHEAVDEWSADATTVKLGAGATSVVVDSASLQSFFTAVNAATGVPIPVGYTSSKVKA